VIWENITSRYRNKIRKAKENGIEIRHGKDLELLKKFRHLYYVTMDKDHAEEYYYFGEAFFESNHRDLHDNYEMI
jgi:lipid II:glycine glycyltransferase (peptidoglycan interpeptide bridge formation enzyme)